MTTPRQTARAEYLATGERIWAELEAAKVASGATQESIAAAIAKHDKARDEAMRQYDRARRTA